MAAKATGGEPFDAPQVLLDAVKAKDYGKHASKELGTVPVNFTADLHITGGNSGSPVMDANGDLVGLVFDMHWAAVVSNRVFDPEMNRVLTMAARHIDRKSVG